MGKQKAKCLMPMISVQKEWEKSETSWTDRNDLTNTSGRSQHASAILFTKQTKGHQRRHSEKGIGGDGYNYNRARLQVRYFLTQPLPPKVSGNPYLVQGGEMQRRSWRSRAGILIRRRRRGGGALIKDFEFKYYVLVLIDNYVVEGRYNQETRPGHH